MSMDRDLQFLYEIGSLRFMPRQWQRYLNFDFANITEHHFRVIWLALIIAKHEKVKDTDKILKMALAHDIVESRTGDADYLSRQYVKRNDKLGAKDMLKQTSLEDEFLKLLHEYEKRESLESKVVKDADTLDVDLELQEQKTQGVGLAKIWEPQRQYVSKNQLYTKTAKRLWREIQKSEPNDWHLKGRNRLNAGDWKD